MTTWAEVRDVLSEHVALGVAGLGDGNWSAERCAWHSDPHEQEGVFATLSVVSSIDEGERADEYDLDLDQVTQLQETRAQAQVLFESYRGSEAHDLAEACRRYFKRTSTRNALADEGVALVMEPAPVRPADYLADGDWVSAALFELPIRFHHLDTETEAGLKQCLTVKYSGTLSGVTTGEQTVTKP